MYVMLPMAQQHRLKIRTLPIAPGPLVGLGEDERRDGPCCFLLAAARRLLSTQPDSLKLSK